MHQRKHPNVQQGMSVLQGAYIDSSPMPRRSQIRSPSKLKKDDWRLDVGVLTSNEYVPVQAIQMCLLFELMNKCDTISHSLLSNATMYISSAPSIEGRVGGASRGVDCRGGEKRRHFFNWK